jgi:hypothetical protein
MVHHQNKNPQNHENEVTLNEGEDDACEENEGEDDEDEDEEDELEDGTTTQNEDNGEDCSVEGSSPLSSLLTVL